jgi:transcriptional regulator with XRE-family HTH domain
MSSTKRQMLNNLQTGNEYRQAFVEEAIRTRITAQIHALRMANQLDYKQFADKLGKKVAWAYRLEDPNQAPPTIPTLLQIAGALDIAVDVRFLRFSELLNDVISLDETSFFVPSFEAEMKADAFAKAPRVKKNPRRRKPALEAADAPESMPSSPNGQNKLVPIDGSHNPMPSQPSIGASPIEEHQMKPRIPSVPQPIAS